MPGLVYTVRSSHTLPGRRPNLLVRIAAGVVSAIMLLASAFLGLLIFLAVLGALAVTGAVLAVRFRLFQRRMEAVFKREAPQDFPNGDHIDVEYEERE